MQFEEFDKKLREAADHHHPTYDEKAWEKMHKLLDKHLPEEKDRRRILFFVVLFFLGLGGGALVILKPWKNTNVAALEKPLPISSEQKIEEPIIKDFPVSPAISKLKISQEGKIRQAKNQNNSPQNIKSLPADKEKISEPILSNKNVKTDDPFSLQPDKKTGPGKIDLVKPAEQTTTTPPEQVSQPPKAKNKKQNEFFVSASAGPDISIVNGNAGAIKVFGGAGIGYSFKDRITLRAGFYSGRKIYSAGPDSYNPPPEFYIYYPYLEKVDANCEVYELPVSVSYNFGKSSRQNFFASVGVSSYFMKKEEYKYFYKYTPTGPTVSKSRTIKNINQHPFSGLTLSAGYNRRLTRHFSLTAEPYIKLPLQGLGYGKVKLNSAGISMSMSISPFAKKPK